MAKREIALVLMSMLLLIASSEGQIDFNYYLVVFQWQPGTCSGNLPPGVQECANTPENKFSIHGVWPSDSSGDPVTCPGNPAYDATKINSIQGRLNQDWPNVIYGTNPTLWSHEWTAHGTCSKDYMDQLQYFTFGLDQFAKYDVKSMLTRGGINPDGTQYSKKSVSDAIRAETGMTAAVRCNTNKSSNELQLYEIALCFTKLDRKLTNCPKSVSTSCTKPFKWNSWSGVEDNPAIASS